MAVELTDTSANFTGTGVSSTYAAPIYANDDDQIAVYVDTVKKTLGDDYVLNGLGSASGISIVATFPLNSAIYVERVTPIKQEVDTQNNESILQDVLDNALDKLTMMMQERAGETNRALLVPKGQDGFVLDTAGLTDGDILQFSAPGRLTRLVRSVFAGKFYGGDVTGKLVPLSGTGADAALRTDLATSVGGSLVGWIRSALGAVTRSVRDTLRDKPIYVTEFGAVGDGVTDCTAAFQAALNAAGLNGGGTYVFVPAGNWRITSGLKIPSYVGLRGATPSRYPYAAGNTGVSKIIADFANPYQWVLDAAVKIAGNYLAYNAIVAGNLPDETCYNISVQDLLITSVNAIPYGGIRMAGAPGSMVRDVCVYRVGCGLLVNYGFGGEYHGHFHTWYYGAVGWGEANANSFSVYCARHTTGDVPADYLLPFMAALNGQLTTTYKLSTNAHYNRSIGVIVGSLASTTANFRVVEATAERFDDGFFTLNAYSTFIGGLYVEGSTNDVKHGFVAAASTFSCSAIHQFLSGTGALFDFGNNVDGYINYSGSGFAASFGKPPEVEIASEIRLGTLKPGFMSVTNQFNLKFPDKDGDWIAPALTGAGDLGAPNNPFGYRITRQGKIEFRGGLTGVGTGTVPFQLPAGFRPFYTQMLAAFGGTADVRGSGGTPADAGKLVITSGGPTIIFDSVKPFDQVS